MLVKKKKSIDNVATRVMTHIREYGVGNPKGEVFDRMFNREDTMNEIDASRNTVGQGVRDMVYPNGFAPEGYSTFSPALGVSNSTLDASKVQDAIANNQIELYWRKNVERALKYNTVANRSEVNESIIQICNEAVYKDDLDEICSLSIDQDAAIGKATKKLLHKIFRQECLNKIMRFDLYGWEYMKYLLIHGRIFFEVIYDENKSNIIGLQMLREENMIIVVQDNIIIGYRQMLDGAIGGAKTGGKNYIDFSPNQILYGSLGLTGPGGVNDPRSILEAAMKPYNQLTTIEDSVVMYRILWGSEKLILYVDTSGMPKDKAEKQMKDQAKQFSRKLDYNTSTGEVTNFGKAIGLTEHYLIGIRQGQQGSKIERMQGGDQLGNIDDLKFFKRNLVNSLMVPPGRITALAGDSNNYSSGKIGEVTQSEVAFARLVQRYQTPIEQIMVRLFVMILETKHTIQGKVKTRDLYKVRFKRSNGFQNFIESELLTTNLGAFDTMVKNVKSKDNPSGSLSMRYALRKGLHMNDEDYILNEQWKEEEEWKESGEDGNADDGSGGGDDAGGMGGFPGM